MNISFNRLIELEKFSEEAWHAMEQKLPKFLSGIDVKEQGFYTVFSDDAFLEEKEKIKKYAVSQKGKWKDIVVCGIGGSALGARMIQESLHNTSISPVRLHVLENIDPQSMSAIQDCIDLASTLFIVISKSGGTIETVSQYLWVSDWMKKEGKSPSEHMVVITGNSGFLYEESIKHSLRTFCVPENIGGRFSVLTAVGLLPSALLGVDIDSLIEGGKEMADIFQDRNPQRNTVFQFALASYFADEPIHVLMPYASGLRNVGLWYAQLLAESTGKQEGGYTLLPALGVTDQHSQLQLFADGPKDKLIIFITVDSFPVNQAIVEKLEEGHPYAFLQDCSFQTLLQKEQQGTQLSLHEKKVPTMNISLSSISEKEMGRLIVFLEGVVAFYGEMMGINVFDQPGVERGKHIAKSLLMAE